MPKILHRIRLQGPWDVIPPGRDPDDFPEPVDIPAGWRDLFGDAPGTATFLRKFNTPSGLEPGDRLWIQVPEDCGEIVSVHMNGQAAMAVPDEPRTFDVTELVDRFNSLSISLRCDPLPADKDRGGLWQPVGLLIVGAGD